MRKQLILFICIITISCIIYSCQNAGEIEQAKYMSNGKDLYVANCQNCHGANGEGLGELAPPLTDTVFLKNNKSKLACYIKHGANEPMVIHGKTYHEKMPAFNQLENIDITQVIVFITNSFGNKQGSYKPEQVAKDLENCSPRQLSQAGRALK